MDSGRSARVGVAFIILGFSLLGVLPPIVASVRRQRRGGYDDAAHGGASALLLRVKAFAAGVMLSLSVVHVCYDAFAELSTLEAEERYPLYAGYPMAGPFVVLGILGMFFLEQGALDYITRLEAQATPEAAARGDVESAMGDGVTPKELEHAPSSGEHAHAHLNMLDTLQAAHTHTKFCASGAVGAAHHAAAPVAEPACGGCEHEHTHLNLLDAVQAAHTHTHLCAAGGASGGKDAALAVQTPSRQLALCLSLELSIVVHSVIIGFELGMNPDNSTLVGLVTVLCFHQFFEGLGLGSYIGHMASSVPLAKLAAMAATFSLSVPVGIFIGVGVSLHTGDEISDAKVWTLGAFNGVSGGMLLYMTLITFIGEEFTRSDLHTPQLRGLKYQMWALLVCGAAAMALLGIWA